MSNAKTKELKALIIDDELDTCLLLGMVLKKIGIQSVRAHTLAEGFSKIQSENPEIVFLDNNLPDGTGIESLAKFRNLSPNAKLIMITAMSNLKEQALQLGASEFVEKPLDLKKIQAVI